MNDNEARGLVLKRLYELRDKDGVNFGDFQGFGMNQNVLGRLLEHLADKGLIRWKPLRGGMNTYLAFMANISGAGVDVVEGVTAPPPSITIDNSIAVHGSQGVMIGGQGNIQNVTLDVERLNSFIDSCGASVEEKAEAKGLLKRVAENPLVKIALEWFVKSQTGG